MATGIVKWFNDAKGFGFIIQDSGGEGPAAAGDESRLGQITAQEFAADGVVELLGLGDDAPHGDEALDGQGEGGDGGERDDDERPAAVGQEAEEFFLVHGRGVARRGLTWVGRNGAVKGRIPGEGLSGGRGKRRRPRKRGEPVKGPPRQTRAGVVKR